MDTKKEFCDLVAIPETSLSLRFVRAGGPGGQHVNKTSSAVRLFFNTHCLDGAVRKRLQRVPKAKLSKNGTLLVVAREHRSQRQNIDEAYQRLADVLAVARRKPKVRVPTMPTKASQERRLLRKKRHGQKKAHRRVLED
ncbi:MAG: alternative ribosome rescue aminoacyl-tRNA hydrolase ArfB [Candidatus Kaiserbacteria bacterium]|nr:alternative ribosome rescue aminoacyl-tRNA hydrolase ArfB [Candidatus Kaiserbacteria bacterium]